MSRKRTTKDSIRNPENYFNSFIALEIQREKQKQFEIHDMELSIEEHVLDISITYQCAVNKAQEDFERVTLGDERLSWIETIKDERLYNAIQQLSEQQKLILVGKTQLVAKSRSKNASSRRTLPLVPKIESLLVKMKETQKDYQLLCKSSYCRDFIGYVYVNKIGKLVSPDSLSAKFKKTLRQNNLRVIRLHDLRHPYVKPTTRFKQLILELLKSTSIFYSFFYQKSIHHTHSIHDMR